SRLSLPPVAEFPRRAAPIPSHGPFAGRPARRLPARDGGLLRRPARPVSAAGGAGRLGRRPGARPAAGHPGRPAARAAGLCRLPWGGVQRAGPRHSRPAGPAARLHRRADRRLEERPAPGGGAGLHGRHRRPAHPPGHRCPVGMAGVAPHRRTLPARPGRVGGPAGRVRQPGRALRGGGMKLIKQLLLVLVLAVAEGISVLYWVGTREDDADGAAAVQADAGQLVERGRYLARLGNCSACHTARGGQAYAGGTPIPTPFGTLYGPIITPDRQTGIGTWSADDFWRALHNGKSRDGSLLYPAFPYTEYSRITRADADALYAFLRTVEPVERANRPHDLAFPYDQRWLLAVWRALYFRPGVQQDQPDQPAQWNRGRYLVQGLGHCAACH